MIIDTHTHYCHRLYEGEFYYLGLDAGRLCISRGELSDVLSDMEKQGIPLCIEPSIGLDEIPRQTALEERFKGRFLTAFGVHPKRAMQTDIERFSELRRYVLGGNAVAVGETGLDYSVEAAEDDIAKQKLWFAMQTELSHEAHLPLILHIRDAYGDAIEMLRKRRGILFGGAAHCFRGDFDAARALIDLGFALGIGGKILDAGEEGRMLRDTVRRVPLSSIILETDVPYIKPDIGHLGRSQSQRNKTRNTSLILPTVLDTIANIRAESRETVEKEVFLNTLRTFGLDVGKFGILTY